MGPEHVEAVSRLHAESLTGLLTLLGRPAVEAYYTGCVRTQAAVAFVAVEDGAVCGFVLGSPNPEQLRRRIVRHNRRATLAALALGILKRPQTLVWLLRSVKGPDEGEYDIEAAELVYLAVDAARRGSGTGTDLVHAFTSAIRGAGVRHYELSVDDDNEAAIGFYERLGFSLMGRYREFGTWHRRYQLEVP